MQPFNENFSRLETTITNLSKENGFAFFAQLFYYV
jgi:hypothetical protein